MNPPAIRVAFAEMRPRLRTLLTQVAAREPDFEVLHFERLQDLNSSAAVVDAVVCEVEDPTDRELPKRVLAVAPHARLVLIATTGLEATVYTLKPVCRRLSNVSLDQVLAAIRYGLREGPGEGGHRSWTTH